MVHLRSDPLPAGLIHRLNATSLPPAPDFTAVRQRLAQRWDLPGEGMRSPENTGWRRLLAASSSRACASSGWSQCLRRVSAAASAQLAGVSEQSCSLLPCALHGQGLACGREYKALGKREAGHHRRLHIRWQVAPLPPWKHHDCCGMLTLSQNEAGFFIFFLSRSCSNCFPTLLHLRSPVCSAGCKAASALPAEPAASASWPSAFATAVAPIIISARLLQHLAQTPPTSDGRCA